MAHQSGSAFFREKRPWSKRKDLILGYYVKPYLPKIATQRRPICIIDAFAGPGAFDDGEPGSPLIICKAIRDAEERGASVPIRAMFIEADPQLHAALKERIAGFEFASAHFGTFLDRLPEIVATAGTHSTLLYLDPYAVEGLEWAAMDQVFSHLQKGVSIELLMNFNVVSLVRRGLAALKMAVPAPDEAVEDSEDIEPITAQVAPMVTDIDRIVGGDWWQAILLENEPFQQKVAHITKGFCDLLRSRFREVCIHDVKAKWHHRNPKYVLVFGSRHPDAFELMNDAMAKSREVLIRPIFNGHLVEPSL